jgi:hypothetical protein
MNFPVRLTFFMYASTLLALAPGCSEAPTRDGPDLGSAPSTGDSSGPDLPTGGPGGSGPTPTTGSPEETGPGTTGTASTASTGEPDPVCGDGVLDPGEQCDDGAANSDNAFCTVDCLLNTCGDGLVFVGWELCDQGSSNNDAYGHACTTMCTPGARCGDHIVQPEEECDLGVDNGGKQGDEQGIMCDAACTTQALRAFVTSQAFSGNLGGIAGADKKCRDAATAAGLPEPYRFHAYLSTPDSPANDRFPGALAVPLPYVLVMGMKVADSHAKLLVEGPLAEGISVTELGVSIYDEIVATNTTPHGNTYSPDQHCLGWTSADPLLKARVGLTFPGDPGAKQDWLLDGQWIGRGTATCDKPYLHLYCLEI